MDKHLKEFRRNKNHLAAAFGQSINKACENIEFDIRCLDWFSLTPDFHIENKNKKVA